MSECIGTSSVAENISTERRVATEPVTCRNHIVQALANCRNLAVASAIAESSFQLLTSGALIAMKAPQVVMVKRNQMLRITRKANGEVVFKVSGQLQAENVVEVETLITAEGKGRRIVLDCTDLRSVDGEAVKFLEKWEADSIRLKNCGLYIREWIRRERLERKSDKSSAR
jgi:MFS superfamily sulfate permease-like transporter